MGTAGRSAPLRRAGLLLGLLGLELGAVVGLHWLGRLSALRIAWERPLPWLLTSPVQEVLGAILRTVGLVMAYWLLATTLLYLLASLTRLPAAVRAVRWATLPLVRRVADHAVAVTLATSMVGGGTLATAGPAVAAPAGASGPAGQATSTTLGQAAREPSAPRWRPDPAGPAAPGPAESQGTTSTTRSQAAAQPTTTSAAPPTTLRSPRYRFSPPTSNREEGREASGSDPSNQPREPAEPSSGSGPSAGSGSGSGPGSGPGNQTGGRNSQGNTGQLEPHVVARGDNLWTIARAGLAEATGRKPGELSNREIAVYWERVVAVNRDQLDSGDPDLIYPGEKIELPPVER